MNDQLDAVFTPEQPLGPIAINEDFDPVVLKALYDMRAHKQMSSTSPPTFIVGRRGSGKTALLLSTLLDKRHTTVQLSTDEAFGRVADAVEALRTRAFLPEEGVADLWEMLLWGPIAMRLVEKRDTRDPRADFQRVWEETSVLRQELPRYESGRTSQDDAVLDLLATRLIDTIQTDNSMRGTSKLKRVFRVGELPWAECTASARRLIAARRADVFVLVDSLENLGEHLDTMELTLRGLFHLVGQVGLMPAQRRPFQLQCCFPSELWPNLHEISANPTKDFASRTVLQWRGDDLLHAAATRLEIFLERHFPRLDLPKTSRERLLAVLPDRIVNLAGRDEPTVAYMLRHTQLLPRHFFFMLNEALARALTATGLPIVRPVDIVEAVKEVEATLCPEIFAAHRFRYPQALDATKRLIPFLPFRFAEGHLQKACRMAGIEHEFQMESRDVREMFAHLGIIGRFKSEKDAYISAEFEYTVEGSLNLSPREDYCLHPLFARLYTSPDTLSANGDSRPVYPSGTPLPSE